ncbi:MAG: type II toxin-antitoxin system VapC family toxin [Candidatus Competibacteraceae bacterium]
MSYLVDTNIISELSRLHPNAGVLNWAQGISRFAISVISLDEIFFGLAWHPNARVRSWMEGFFQRHEVLSVDETVARRAGELRGQFSARGIVRSQADMLIAATAQVHQLTLTTRNTRDFEGCGIGLLNPFSDSGA